MARIGVAGSATLVAALFSAGLWVAGQAQYIEDYCHTRAPQPASTPPEALSGRPGYLDGPVTIRCEYDQAADVLITDPTPLIGAVVLAFLVIAVAVGFARWASRPEGTRTPADHGQISSG